MIICEISLSRHDVGINVGIEEQSQPDIMSVWMSVWAFLRDMLSQGDYANVLETAFEKYNVDQLKMFRYASHDILS